MPSATPTLPSSSGTGTLVSGPMLPPTPASSSVAPSMIAMTTHGRLSNSFILDTAV
jgi:hypothetical protein